MEQETLETLTEKVYEEIGRIDRNAISEFIDEIWGLEYCLKYDFADLVSEIEDAYEGQYSDGAEFAEQMANDMGDLNGVEYWIVNHIDWDAVWNCELSHDYTETSNGYIFRRI